jgi:hypothetical protein
VFIQFPKRRVLKEIVTLDSFDKDSICAIYLREITVTFISKRYKGHNYEYLKRCLFL